MFISTRYGEKYYTGHIIMGIWYHISPHGPVSTRRLFVEMTLLLTGLYFFSSSGRRLSTPFNAMPLKSELITTESP